MNISAIAGLAAQPMPGAAPLSDREALGQEFGRLLFGKLMASASLSVAGAKERKPMQAFPIELLSDQFAQDLAVQHRQLFAQMLLGSADGQAAR
ncbi:MAG: hypothetical protein NTV19_13035 [Burkholderiales bacterium]|nr:hypothetical protein [Burkholderiales bacterium]